MAKGPKDVAAEASTRFFETLRLIEGGCNDMIVAGWAGKPFETLADEIRRHVAALKEHGEWSIGLDVADVKTLEYIIGDKQQQFDRAYEQARWAADQKRELEQRLMEQTQFYETAAETETTQNTRWLLLAHGATALACLNALPSDRMDGLYGTLVFAAAGSVFGLFVTGTASALRLAVSKVRASIGSHHAANLGGIDDEKAKKSREKHRRYLGFARWAAGVSYGLLIASFGLLVGNIGYAVWRLDPAIPASLAFPSWF